MGIYVYITEQDRVSMRKVTDPELQELFNEAHSYDESLMISECHYPVKRRFIGYKTELRYQIYHESGKPNEPAYQAKQMICASGDLKVVKAYLYGIINGYLHSKQNNQ